MLVKLNKDNCCEQQPVSPTKYLETYVRLANARVIFLSEIITKEVAAQLSAMLLYYDNEDPNEEISMYINSPGGDAAALANIYDVMQMISAPIQTICIGKAYSAGAVLLAAGSKGNRLAFKHAKIMIHGIQCLFPIIGQDQVNSSNYYKFLKQNNDNIMKILANHTGNSLEKVREDCSRDCYLDAKQACEYGIIDNIII
jgi:ATP-dependent Clp protease protease subunit